jgi:amidase
MRIPASFCGIPSIRPTINRVSRHGNIPSIVETSGLQPLLTFGAFGASISWLEKFMRVACDDFIPIEEIPPRIRILISPYIETIDIDERLVKVMNQIVPVLQIVKSVTADKILPNLPLNEMRSSYDTLATLPTKNEKYDAALMGMQHARSVVDEMMKEYDVWILPCCAVLPFPHNPTKAPVKIQHATLKEIKYWKVMGYTTLISLIGNPVVTLPVAMIDGLPVGVQIVGKRNKDEDLLAICKLLEPVFAKYITKPPINSIRSML